MNKIIDLSGHNVQSRAKFSVIQPLPRKLSGSSYPLLVHEEFAVRSIMKRPHRILGQRSRGLENINAEGRDPFTSLTRRDVCLFQRLPCPPATSL